MPLAWNGERVSNGIVFLFDGDAGFVQRDLAILAGHVFRAHVHEHQMIVRAAADEAVAVALHAVGQRRGVFHNLLLIRFERRLQGFVKTNRLGRR